MTNSTLLSLRVSVKNHANATKNKYAQYQRKITVDQVLNARKTAHKPLGLYDFAPISDGASALILTSETVAKKMNAQSSLRFRLHFSN